jgi:hypothetical protein
MCCDGRIRGLEHLATHGDARRTGTHCVPKALEEGVF